MDDNHAPYASHPGQAEPSSEKTTMTTNDDAPISRRRRWAFRIGTLVITPILVLALAEIPLRLIGDPPRPLPNLPMDNAALVDESRNKLNLRERWETVPGDDTTLRIAFLGDSFTYAACVEQEEGFVDKIERSLNPPGRWDYVTINMGKPGSDPVDQIAVYAAVKDAIKPDVVVHVLYCNDLDHDLNRDLSDIHRLQNTLSIPAQFFSLWRFIETRCRYTLARRRTLAYFRGGDSPFKREQAWTRLRRGVETVRDMARSDGARYAVVFFPWLHELRDYPLEDVHVRMKKLVDELGVPFLDLLDTYRGRPANLMRISPVDEHPTPLAHDLAAEAIIKFLRRNDLLRRTPTDEVSKR